MKRLVDKIKYFINDWSQIIILGFSYNIQDDLYNKFRFKDANLQKNIRNNEISELKKIISNLEDRFGKFRNYLIIYLRL